MRSPTIILAISSLTLASATASADVGFAAAAKAARGAAPLGKLLQVEQRVRNGVQVYDADLFQSPGTDWSVRVNRTSGAVMGVEQAATPAEDVALYEQILSMLPEATIDFGGAVERAIPHGPEGAAVSKVSLDIELAMLAYQVSFDGSDARVYVDSVTGNVVPHHGADDDQEVTVPGANFVSALDAAVAAAGAPALSAEAEAEDVGAMLESLHWDAKAGELVLVTTRAGDSVVLGVVRWVPTADQAARLADEVAALGSASVSASAALASALEQHPTAALHGIEFEAEDAGSSWLVQLITDQGFELDVVVSATNSAAFRIQAAVNFHAADLDRDGRVSGTDLGILVGLWGAFDPTADLTGDNMITGADLGVLVGAWQP